MTEPKPPAEDPAETPESTDAESTPDDSEDEDGLDDEVEDEDDDDDDDDSFDEAGYMSALSALKKDRTKVPVPELSEAVEDKIRKRSGGRFFGDRSLTDRMSIGIIALLILAIGVGVFYLLKGSETGTLKLKKGEEAPELAPGAREAMPRP
ncbi:MAG: hypothetical protein KJO07_03585 [Deltaproteobacteria bacterium]|nr:hypothetical protein [Deltaproteobacteria bacterium]